MLTNKSLEAPLYIEYQQDKEIVDSKGSTRIISGWRKTWIHLQLKISLIKIAWNCYKNPITAITALKFLVNLRREVLGNFRVQKLCVADGKYFMGLYSPGWNSDYYRKFIQSEILHFKPHNRPTFRLNQAFIAITQKCALQCEHCYAWDTLNQKDALQASDWENILDKIQEPGVLRVLFTGGEPLMKFDLLLRLVRKASVNSEVWINTSGFRLSFEKAQALKAAGLNGLMISLDHHNPKEHNAFRNYAEAYPWAIRATANAQQAGLLTCWSVCIRPEVVHTEFLEAYLELAKNHGVQFVQLLEPKSVGHYKDKTRSLNSAEIQIAESFFERYNFSAKYNAYPLISYHGYYQRRKGCFGSGKRGIYIDAKGQINACPFCHKSYGDARKCNTEEVLEKMQGSGCQIEVS